MKRYVLSPFAGADLDELISYLKTLPLEPANRIGSRIRTVLEDIGQHPFRGPAQSEITRIMRFEVRGRLVGAYWILYRVGASMPEILGIIHGARDIPAIMAGRVQ